MSERETQNEIRNALVDHGLFFRANVGQAWTGDAQRLPNGDVLIRNARPFQTGLPKGFSDIFGLTNAGQFAAIECKSSAGRARPEQSLFIGAIQKNGGLAGIARSVEDALRIIGVKP